MILTLIFTNNIYYDTIIIFVITISTKLSLRLHLKTAGMTCKLYTVKVL